MSECDKIQALISAMLDGELGEDERRQVTGHIAHCDECAQLYESFAAVSRAIGEETRDMPAGLHDKIMTAVDVAAKQHRLRQLNRSVRHFASAAACLAVVVGVVLLARGSMMMGNSKSADAAPRAANYSAESAGTCDDAAQFSVEGIYSPAEVPAEGDEKSVLDQAAPEATDEPDAPVPEPDEAPLGAENELVTLNVSDLKAKEIGYGSAQEERKISADLGAAGSDYRIYLVEDDGSAVMCEIYLMDDEVWVLPDGGEPYLAELSAGEFIELIG